MQPDLRATSPRSNREVTAGLGAGRAAAWMFPASSGAPAATSAALNGSPFGHGGESRGVAGRTGWRDPATRLGMLLTQGKLLCV